jgi:hypothetical protein
VLVDSHKGSANHHHKSSIGLVEAHGHTSRCSESRGSTEYAARTKQLLATTDMPRLATEPPRQSVTGICSPMPLLCGSLKPPVLTGDVACRRHLTCFTSLRLPRQSFALLSPKATRRGPPFTTDLSVFDSGRRLLLEYVHGCEPATGAGALLGGQRHLR